MVEITPAMIRAVIREKQATTEKEAEQYLRESSKLHRGAWRDLADLHTFVGTCLAAEWAYDVGASFRPFSWSDKHHFVGAIIFIEDAHLDEADVVIDDLRERIMVRFPMVSEVEIEPLSVK